MVEVPPALPLPRDLQRVGDGVRANGAGRAAELTGAVAAEAEDEASGIRRDLIACCFRSLFHRFPPFNLVLKKVNGFATMGIV